MPPAVPWSPSARTMGPALGTWALLSMDAEATPGPGQAGANADKAHKRS